MSVEDVKIDSSAFAATGIANVDLKDGADIQVDIKRVAVGSRAMAFVGYQNVDLNADIFKGWKEAQ